MENKIIIYGKLSDYNNYKNNSKNKNNINYTMLGNQRYKKTHRISSRFPAPTSLVIKNSIKNKEHYKNNIKNNFNANNKNNLISLFSILLLILLSSLVFAIPDSLTLQGKLTDLSGSSQEGTFNFTFKIYDAYTGGNTLYQVINTSVTTDANGIYDIILYNLSSLNFSDQYYLGIAVQGDDESQPRINLTSSPYSFRANISEDLNKENKYEVAVINITGNLTVGGSFADVLTVITGRLNISDGSITAAGNLTLGERISFSLGSIIDNLVSGFLRISGGLNVTGNVSIAQDTLFVDNTSGRVGIGTTAPGQELTVIGNINATGNITSGTGTIILDSTNDRIGIGTTLPSHALDVYGNVSIKGNLSVDSNLSVDGSTFFVDSLSNRVGIGTVSPATTLDVSGTVTATAFSGDGSSLTGIAGAGLWNSSGANIFLNDSTAKLGIGTSAPQDALEVIGNVRISGSLNASFINATEIRQGTNLVQTINAVFNLGNLTDFFGDSSFNDSVLRVGNISNILGDAFKVTNLTRFLGEDGNASLLRTVNISKDLAKSFNLFTRENVTEYLGDDGNASLLRTGNLSVIFEAAYNKANYSSEYASTGFDRENVTDYLGEDGNASLLRTVNISKDLAKSFNLFTRENVTEYLGEDGNASL
ncbi:MAG: hypothetical protein IH934_06700, partial [Nanoarchaeota archaeon]|nr:hypothetical protein [Nanoarchaeota archaeon]